MQDAYAAPPRSHQDERTPAVASQFLHHLPDLLTPGELLRIAVLVRVSSSNQARGDKLELRLASLLRGIRHLPVRIARNGRFLEECSGWDWDDRRVFRDALQFCRRNRTVLVVASTDRLLRNRFYAGNRDCLPTIADFRRLMVEADGVTLATVLHPDAPEPQVHSEQPKRNPRNGRPANVRWTPVRRELLLRLFNEGKSIRDAADAAGLQKSTVQRHFAKLRTNC